MFHSLNLDILFVWCRSRRSRMTLSITSKRLTQTLILKRTLTSMMKSTLKISQKLLLGQLQVRDYWTLTVTRLTFAFVFSGETGNSHEAESSASSPGGASSPISSPALNHQQGTGSTTTPSSNATPATPNDSDERRTRTHRSSTDESHPKTPAVAPVKPAPIKAKIVQTTPSKSSTGLCLVCFISNLTLKLFTFVHLQSISYDAEQQFA